MAVSSEYYRKKKLREGLSKLWSFRESRQYWKDQMVFADALHLTRKLRRWAAAFAHQSQSLRRRLLSLTSARSDRTLGSLVTAWRDYAEIRLDRRYKLQTFQRKTGRITLKRTFTGWQEATEARVGLIKAIKNQFNVIFRSKKRSVFKLLKQEGFQFIETRSVLPQVGGLVQ